MIGFLRKSGIFVDPMEDWVADSDEPKQFSRERADGCELCVLLVAFRRGHVPKGETESITQMEYRYAVDHGIDVLCFLLDADAPWPRRFDEMRDDPDDAEVSRLGIRAAPIADLAPVAEALEGLRDGRAPHDHPAVTTSRGNG